MYQSRQIYKETFEPEEQRSIEFNEYPELEKYYTSRKKSSEKKPTKIILTEIYSQSKTYMQSNNNFTQCKSYKNINAENKQIIHSNINNSQYNTNDIHNINNMCNDFPPQLNIKKRIYCNSQEKTMKIKDDEDLLENFKYYERRNIRDKSNQKYESITKVIGYGNIIPLKNQKVTQNITNININKNEYKKYQNNSNTENKGTNYLISKTNKTIEKNYMIKKETVAKTQQNIKKEFKKPAQLDNNKRSELIKKYEINKKQEIKTNDYKQYERKKKEEVKNNNNTQIKKYNIQIKKNETQKTTNNLNKYKKTEKKEIKEPIIIKRKENIKQQFTIHSGRYTYKDDISKDIINSRKNYNENSQEKNLKRISIVQTNSTSKSKSATKNKSNVNNETNKNYKVKINTNNKYKKEETTKKAGTNITNKININTNMSNYKRKGNDVNKVQTNIKSNINIKTESYGKIDMSKYKREKKEENEKVNIKEMNKVFESKIKDVKKRNQTPKLKIINFGDNYRFYESKYLLYPDDSCITVHHLRSKNIIEEGDDFNTEELSNFKAYKQKPFTMQKKYDNQINCYSNDVNDDYENEDYYIEQNREYCY